MLVDDARSQVPQFQWLPGALANCPAGKWESQAYIRYIPAVYPNQPGSPWQFQMNIVINHGVFGMVVIDVLQGNRIGGIELVDRLS